MTQISDSYSITTADSVSKRALVSGASQGIGRAIAERLAADGFSITALARNERKLKDLITGLPGGNHDYLAIDLGDLPALRDCVSRALRKGAYSVLVCNGGGPKPGLMMDATTDDFARAFQEHVLANHTLAQCLVPGMKEQKHGRIINVISTSVKAPIPNLLVSNTIRAAVASWAKSLANELGAYGITVNNVLPGYTATERLSSLRAATAKRTGKSEDDVKKTWLESIPAKRFGEPAEIAAVVGFLASSGASYVNGINVPVDGGRTPAL